jgi:hypothetical protein
MFDEYSGVKIWYKKEYRDHCVGYLSSRFSIKLAWAWRQMGANGKGCGLVEIWPAFKFYTH